MGAQGTLGRFRAGVGNLNDPLPIRHQPHPARFVRTSPKTGKTLTTCVPITMRNFRYLLQLDTYFVSATCLGYCTFRRRKSGTIDPLSDNHRLEARDRPSKDLFSRALALVNAEHTHVLTAQSAMQYEGIIPTSVGRRRVVHCMAVWTRTNLRLWTS